MRLKWEVRYKGDRGKNRSRNLYTSFCGSLFRICYHN